MASSEKPKIFLLSLSMQSYFDEQHASWIDNLSNSAQLQRAQTANAAIKYLRANKPKAILVTDEGLTKAKNKTVLAEVQTYLSEHGGLVIFGLHFPSFIKMDVFDGFWGPNFGVGWKRGDYHRSIFQANPSCTLPLGVTADSLPSPYSMKVLHVKGAKPEEKIFVPVPGGQTQSMVFPPSFVDQTQAAVVGSAIGRGFLVYIGDVNKEDESEKIILALCGL